MIKHVIWDWNGTLIDDVGLCVDVLNHILIRYNIKSLTVEEYRNLFFFPVSNFYKTLGLPSSGTDYELLTKDFIDQYRKNFTQCDLHFSALHTVKRLNSMGISQSILSAGCQSDVETFVKFFKIESFISFIDGAKDIQANRKDNRALKHLSFLNMRAEDSLLVGDTCHDWEIARLIGCSSILFTKGHVSAKRLKRLNSTTIESLADIAGLLSN